MRANDLQIRKVGGEVIDVHRIAVAQLDPAAPGRTRSRCGVTAMEHDYQAQVTYHLPKRVETRIVRKEVLSGRIQLPNSNQAKLFLASTRLLQRSLSQIGRASCRERV